MSNHTPGPWFQDRHGRIWRRHPAELHENGGGVAGDKPIAVAYVGWHGDGEQGFPLEANARLIAAAPGLLEALLECIAAIERTEHCTQQDRLAAADIGRAAIAKTTGARA